MTVKMADVFFPVGGREGGKVMTGALWWEERVLPPTTRTPGKFPHRQERESETEYYGNARVLRYQWRQEYK